MDLDVKYKRRRGVKGESEVWSLSKDGAAIYYVWKFMWKQVWGISEDQELSFGQKSEMTIG